MHFSSIKRVSYSFIVWLAVFFFPKSALAAAPLDPGSAPAGLPQLEQLVTRLINLTVPLAFIALTVMLLWAGIKFLTSGGEPNDVKAAREILTWSLLGILFLALAWLMLKIVGAFTGFDVTNFSLNFSP